MAVPAPILILGFNSMKEGCLNKAPLFFIQPNP